MTGSDPSRIGGATGPTEAVIELDDVTVAFGDRRVVDGVSLRVTEHRLGIVGANGSGKSTLARVIGGLITATTGQVRVAGLDPARDGRAARERIGFCFADPDAQIVMPTVREDVAFSLRRSGLDKATRAAKVERALDRFGLSHLAEAAAHRLSSGEKQLLALAATLVREPALVICDEPTTLLDLRNATEMAQLLYSLPEQLVIISHDLALLRRCERVIRLDDGVLTDDGDADSVIERYRHDMARLE